MNNTDFVNKAINSHCKISHYLNSSKYIGAKTLILIALCCLNRNLAIAQQQSKPDTTSSTIDAKKDTAYTVTGKRVVDGKDIETIVKYESEDSIVYDMENKLIYLHGKSKVDYGSRSLESDRITIDYTKNSVTSIGGLDSVGKVKGRPVFKEGPETYVADKIVFNFQTKKGVVYGAETQQGEGYITGQAIKKNGDDELFVKGAVYTTCDRKHPHFGFNAHKIKIITNKKILSGPGQLELMGTPLPLFIPFGFFPYPKKRASGILMPALGGSTNSGNFLQNFGMYFAINDYFGLKIISDLYFNGGYNVGGELDYKVNYKYHGVVSYRRNDLISGFGETKTYFPATNNIRWEHTQDAKRRGRFSARVNITSNEYNRQSATPINQYAQQDFYSSINYSRVFPKSGISMNATSTYTNNATQKTVEANLPEVSLGLPNSKPFANVGKSGKLPLLQGVNITPSFSFKNVIYNKIYDSDPYVSNGEYYNYTKINRSIDSIKLNGLTFDDLARHSSYGASWGVSIFTNAKVLKYLTITPSFNVRGNLYDKYLTFSPPNNDSIYYQIQRGLYLPFAYNFGASANTMIYGMIQPRILGLKAIRHTMIPTISYALQPRVNKNSAYYNYMYQENPLNPNMALSRAGGSNKEFVYGAPSMSAYSEIVSFSLTNSIEAKVKDRKDTTETAKDKKIKLIDNISLGGVYNISADSFKLSDINVSVATRLFNRISINGNMTFDPYQYSVVEREGVRTAKRVDKYLVNSIGEHSLKNNNYLADLRQISMNMSMSLNPNWKMKNSYTPEEEALFRLYPYLRHVDFSLPWNATLSYQYSSSRPVVGKAINTQNIRVDGNITMLESWKINFGTTYDVETKKWGGHTLGVIKDLHCWQMMFNWQPSNQFATYTFKMTAKASTLKGFEPIQKRGSSGF